MRRKSLILFAIIYLLLMLTSCQASKDIVKVKNTEKEVILFSQESVKVTLKILVTDAGKEETFTVDREVQKNETIIIELKDLANGYLSEQAVISDVSIDNTPVYVWLYVVVAIVSVMAMISVVFLTVKDD